MICPECQSTFETRVDSDQPVHDCPQCSGTWIGGRALHALLAKTNDSASIERILDSILDLNFHASRRLCPHCGKRHLMVVTIENTELDFCSRCKGLFFDPGELERVLPTIIDQTAPSVTTSSNVSEQGFWAGLLRLLDKN